MSSKTNGWMWATLCLGIAFIVMMGVYIYHMNDVTKCVSNCNLLLQNTMQNTANALGLENAKMTQQRLQKLLSDAYNSTVYVDGGQYVSGLYAFNVSVPKQNITDTYYTTINGQYLFIPMKGVNDEVYFKVFNIK